MKNDLDAKSAPWLYAHRFRMKALYHNCLSSACFRREDALKTEDKNEAQALLREASAFEQVASWLNAAINE